MSQTGGNQNGLDMIWYLVPEPKMKMVAIDKKKGTTMPMARDLRAFFALALLVPCLVIVVLVLIGLVGMGGMFNGGCSPLVILCWRVLEAMEEKIGGERMGIAQNDCAWSFAKTERRKW